MKLNTYYNGDYSSNHGKANMKPMKYGNGTGHDNVLGGPITGKLGTGDADTQTGTSLGSPGAGGLASNESVNKNNSFLGKAK